VNLVTPVRGRSGDIAAGISIQYRWCGSKVCLVVVFGAWLLGLSQFAARAAAGVRSLTGEIGNAHVQVKESKIGSASTSTFRDRIRNMTSLIAGCHGLRRPVLMDRLRHVRDSSAIQTRCHVTPQLHVQCVVITTATP
jgi:hypothetical protein